MKNSTRMLKYDEKYRVLRAELGMYPLKTDVRKLRWSYIVRNMQKRAIYVVEGMYGRK